jgi:hypothetical protein
MHIPTVITFANLKPRATLEAVLREELGELDPIAGRVTGCRARLQVSDGAAPHTKLTVTLAVPEGRLAVDRVFGELAPDDLRRHTRGALRDLVGALLELDAAWRTSRGDAHDGAQQAA